MMALPESGAYPHLVDLATRHALQRGCDFGDKFDFGLGMTPRRAGALCPAGCASTLTRVVNRRIN